MLAWSAQQLGVREATGRNDGRQVEAFQRVTGNRRGDAWCGSYQAAGQQQCRLPFPKGAGGSYNWFTDAKRTYYVRGRRGTSALIQPGHQVGFYYPSLKRVAHIGRAVQKTRTGWYCNEGNTGSGGGRDGAGVHVLLRASWEIYAAANWLN